MLNKLNPNMNLKHQIHVACQYAVENYIAHREGLITQWVVKGVYTQVDDAARKLAQDPLPVDGLKVADAVKEIKIARYKVDKREVRKYLEHRIGGFAAEDLALLRSEGIGYRSKGFAG